ncbi:MAG: caspase family protein, partial [Muribaculaceae bacterium]|nr:caspase family protein [Muribaculaceae bacterium]
EEHNILLEQKRKEEEEQKLIAEQKRKEEEHKQAEARKRLEETPTLKNYISANLGDWNDYLASQNLDIPSEEDIRNLIEDEVSKWQVKGEFEPTARWKERVNETTRAAKINAMADSIFSINSKSIEGVRAEYKKKYEELVDKYCASIAEQFASQTLEIKPYDADNETFLISTTDFGDFLLPVPLDEAPGFKKDWDHWKSTATASFMPNGEDVVLKSVKIGKYSFDSDMNATYAQVDVDYNFKPVDVSMLNRHMDAGEDMAMNSSNGTNSSYNKSFQTEKIKISAGNAPDTDINIPEGKSSDIPTFAVVIANGDYAHASKVSHAENDGKIMAKYLTKTLGIPERNVATFINATYGQMASAISMLQDIGDAYQGNDFNIMFYYVGHGLPDDEGKKSYILPVDIDPRQVSICMPLEKIYADLGSLGAKNVTVMVDACFSGTNHGDGMLIPQSMGVAMKPKSASPVGNMVVLTAAEGNETAFPYEEKSHGLFTYWLLKKLQETSGKVTLGELSDYVIDNVKKTAVTVNRKPQTPTISTSPQLAGSWRALQFGN